MRNTRRKLCVFLKIFARFVSERFKPFGKPAYLKPLFFYRSLKLFYSRLDIFNLNGYFRICIKLFGFLALYSFNSLVVVNNAVLVNGDFAFDEQYLLVKL